jgi:TPR repeat protein
MKCILCEKCEAFRAAVDKKWLAWFEAQANSVAIMEREADPAPIYRAYDLGKTDPVESFRQHLALAEQGSVWSMSAVGHMFEHGDGTAADLVRAELWYVRAHQAGSDYGLIWLGGLYQRSGQHEKAQEVYRAGVERGFAPAMARLAASYMRSPGWRRNRHEAMALLEQASAAGDPWAPHSLASAMMRGWFGLRYIPEAFRRLPSAADDVANPVKDEMASAQSDGKTRSGVFSRLAAQLLLLGVARHPAS